MAQENATIKAVTAEYDVLMEQMSALRKDMAEMAHHVESLASTRGQALAKDMTEGMNGAKDYLAHKTHNADARLEGAVSANPYMALGLATGMGILLGALTRR